MVKLSRTTFTLGTSLDFFAADFGVVLAGFLAAGFIPFPDQ
jgi:hypothetical protein